MANFLDTFATSQDATSTIAYAPLPNGWFPAARRTLDVGNLLIYRIDNVSQHQRLSLDPTMSGGNGSLSYDFAQPQDLTALHMVTFSNCYTSNAPIFLNLNIQVFVNNSPTPVGQTNVQLTEIFPGPDVPVSLVINSNFVNTLSFTFTVSGTGAGGSVVNIGALSSNFSCLIGTSRVLTKEGWRRIDSLQRGQEIVVTEEKTLPLARLIKKELLPQIRVETVVFSPHSLGPGLPSEETISCSEHYWLYQGKRYVAKSFLPFPGVQLKKGQAEEVLPPDMTMYDLQFDEETSYTVNGLTSQSLSPYVQSSPLPRELYFDQSKYREIRVPNTLRADPPISFSYLFPGGREIPGQRKEK